jgi:tRNA A-37 threonylcarbamoyl transferase component Bud32
MRFLIVAVSEDHRKLVRAHIEIEWPDADVVDFKLDEDPPFPPGFAAAGYDAVVVVTAPERPERTEKLLQDYSSRVEFAPVVCVGLTDAPTPQPATNHRVQRLYGRKLNHLELIMALERASNEHRHLLASQRGQRKADKRYQFGELTIRGHRCLSKLGTGGMCSVYLAESERAGRVVVLKVFSQVPDVSERIIGFDRFLQEYEIVAGLNHSNIVRIYDLGVADDHAYIAMEHFAFGDLRQRMKAPISPGTALWYVKKIASALEAIHSVGVLHRDLKPANIMLRGDGSPCLIDFGLAKAQDTDTELTGAREIFGTPYYMSPEQGHAEAVDERSDLYGLGVIFYEMLVGKKPYLGASAMEVIYKHKRAALPVIAPELQRYESILLRLLAKAPAERFQSARELLNAIDALNETP